jgi:hypothetical protein
MPNDSDTVTLEIAGALSVGATVGALGRWEATSPGDLAGAVATVGVAPTGSVVVDVLKNGASAYTIAANRPTIVPGATESQVPPGLMGSVVPDVGVANTTLGGTSQNSFTPTSSAPAKYSGKTRYTTGDIISLAVLQVGTSPLAAPGAPTLAPATTGGTLPAGTTYNYRIVARNASGTSLAGPEAVANATTTGTTSSIVVTWAAVTGAASYDVYGRTAGGELFIVNVTATTYTDTGAVTPAGALPSTATGTTGNAGSDLSVTVQYVTI